MTPFSYDLDGDGEKESYQFGIYQADVPEGYRYTLQDYFALKDGETYARDVYPCVWQYREDGSLALVEAFAPLLTEPQVRVWRVSEEEVPAPEAYTAEGLWRGGLQVLFTLENQGTWLYEIHAKLGGQPLTATACSIVDSYENYIKLQ